MKEVKQEYDFILDLFDTYIKGYDESNRPFLLSSQETKPKIVNSIKPKGDIELKNIHYRLSDKRYVGRKQIKKRTITVYAKTQKECAEKLKQEISKLLNFGNIETKNNRNFLLKDMFMKWFHQEKEPFLSISAQKDILAVYKDLAELHEVSIKKLTKTTLVSFFANKGDNRNKEKTRLYLNACLKYYLNEGIIAVNPCANVKVKKSNNRKQALTFEQQTSLLEALKNKPLYPVILIYLVTGLRKNELNFSAIENDIDFENQILKAVNLKGRNLVKRWKNIKLSKKAISLIMNNLDIIHSYNAETCYREFAEIMKALKIEASIVNLRHTFATNCFYLGKQDVIISKEMGHSKMQLTKDVYTDVDYHLSKEKLLKLYNNLYNLD